MKKLLILIALFGSSPIFASEYKTPCQDTANKYEEMDCLSAEEERLDAELQATLDRFAPVFEEVRSMGVDQGADLERWLIKTSIAHGDYTEELCVLRNRLIGADMGTGASMEMQKCELYLKHDQIRQLKAVLSSL